MLGISVNFAPDNKNRDVGSKEFGSSETKVEAFLGKISGKMGESFTEFDFICDKLVT